MKISVIIVNYNTKQLLKNCIDSIIRFTINIDYEIIVIDNGSVDGSVELLKRDYEHIKLIKSETNLGFGKANNLGAKIANGEYLFLLNSDTILLNNAIKILADYFDINQNTAICGGNLFDTNMQPATSFSQMMPGVTAEIDYLFFGLSSRFKYGKSLFFNFSKQPLKIGGFISGADLMIRKNVFLEVGGFDSDFFLYYEETELTYKVRKRNYNVVNIPQAQIMHLEGASEIFKEKMFIRSFESKIKYFYKTGISNLIPITHLVYQITAFQRIFLFFIVGRKNKVIYWQNLLKYENKVYGYRKKIITDCKMYTI